MYKRWRRVLQVNLATTEMCFLYSYTRHSFIHIVSFLQFTTLQLLLVHTITIVAISKESKLSHPFYLYTGVEMLSFCVRMIIIISKGNSVKFNFNTNFAFLSIYTIIIIIGNTFDCRNH